MKSFKEFSEKCCDECDELFDHVITEAEYQGRKVELNNPTRSNDGKKKFYVYVKNDKGNVIKLGFGDPNMEIKRDDPARRKSFRARHNCSDPNPNTKRGIGVVINGEHQQRWTTNEKFQRVYNRKKCSQ